MKLVGFNKCGYFCDFDCIMPRLAPFIQVPVRVSKLVSRMLDMQAEPAVRKTTLEPLLGALGTEDISELSRRQEGVDGDSGAKRSRATHLAAG